MQISDSRRRALKGLFGGLTLAAGLGLMPFEAAFAQFRVEISGVGATQIPVALGAFKGEARSPQPLSQIIKADLERSGLFKTFDASADKLDETSRPPLSDWRSKGADALLAGSVTALADGRFDVSYHLWDVLKGQDLGGDSLAVPAGDLRQAAHSIADMLYERLTGDKGVFSTRIAYVSKVGKQHTLFIADADGEGKQVALTSVQPIISPAWSPDGRQLAYVSFESGKAAVIVQEVATGRRRVVAGFKGTNSAPAWSPDGRRLAVTLSRDGGSQLYVIELDGGNVRRLMQSASIDTESAWTPDGASIYFVSDRGGSPQIYRVPVAGGSAQRVTFTGSYNISPDISPDGRWMAYIGQIDGAFRVHLMDLRSGDVRALTDSRDDESPSFAPNSKLIMYASRSGGRDVLMTTTLDGRIKAKLPAAQGDLREPDWGPFTTAARR